LADHQAEKSMSADYNVSKGVTSGFAGQLGNLFHRHSIGGYLYE
jgi:hypothetical protein